MMSFKKINTLLILAAILFFAFLLRRDAFWLPHWKGDQSHYAALAMKLDRKGFSGYTLREVRIGGKVLPTDPPIELVFFKPTASGEDGDMIRILKIIGQSYYDESLHFRGPLFPYLLMFSHHFFAGQEPFYSVCSSNLGEKVKTLKPRIIFKAQFWAAIVPIFFNFMVIVMTFLIGWKFFNSRVALWAAFLMAANPVSLTLAYRLLTEDVLTFFLMLSAFLCLVYFPKKNLLGIFGSGLVLGLAILAKQSALLMIVAVWFYTFLSQKNQKKGIFKFVSLEFFLYCLGALFISGPWFLKVYQIFGNPFHAPGDIYRGLTEDLTGWFYTVSHRPPPIFFFSLGVISLSPALGLALLTLKKFCKAWYKTSLECKPETFLWLWVLIFFYFNVEPWHILELSASQEHRFFYMAYPAIALLAAWEMNSLRNRWNNSGRPSWIPDVAAWTILFLNAWWGVPQAMKALFENNMLF